MSLHALYGLDISSLVLGFYSNCISYLKRNEDQTNVWWHYIYVLKRQDSFLKSIEKFLPFGSSIKGQRRFTKSLLAFGNRGTNLDLWAACPPSVVGEEYSENDEEEQMGRIN